MKLKMKQILCAGIVVLTVFAVSTTAFCGLKNWTKVYQGPKKDIGVLMITGNYEKSRLLTDLIQSKNSQPYIVVPRKPGEKFYFVPATGDGMVLDDEKFTKFVKFLNPANILIVGDTTYVPEYFIGKIDKTQTFFRINNKSWIDIAAGAGEILDLPNLAKDYKTLYEQLESGKLYSRNQKNVPEVYKEEVIVDEVAPPAAPAPVAAPVIIDTKAKEEEPAPLK